MQTPQFRHTFTSLTFKLKYKSQYTGCKTLVRRFALPSFLLPFTLSLMSISASAYADGPLTPIHLRIAGREWTGRSACLADDNEVFLPLEMLKAVGAEAVPAPRGDTVDVTLPPAAGAPAPSPSRSLNRHAVLALARPEGEPMVPLSDLARFLNATVVRSEQTDDTGKPIPGSQGDMVYLLARLTDARVRQGMLQVTTSFPVPFHLVMIRDSNPPRGYIDCTGADAPENFHPTPLPADEHRALRLRVGQFNIDTARVVLELADRATLRPATAGAQSRSLITARLNGKQPQEMARGPLSRAPHDSGSSMEASGTQDPSGLEARSRPDTLIPRPSGTRTADPPYSSEGQDPGDKATEQPAEMPASPAAGPNVAPDPDTASTDQTDPPTVLPNARPLSLLELRDVQITPDNDNEVHVHLSTSRRTGVAVHYINGGDLAIEIPGATLNLPEGQGNATLSHPLLRGLTAEQVTSSLLRITLRTNRVAGFTVNIEPNGVMIDLRLPTSATGVLADKVIVVDAGHGGFSTGATAGPIKEKNIVLAIALKLRADLESCGAKVVMTRDKDVYVGLDDRPLLANSIHADLFVSVHNDSNGVPNSASGTSTYYHFQDPSSRALAHCVQQQIVGVSGLPSRGALSDSVLYHSGLAVLRLSRMPAVLVEVAYINNRRDRLKLLDDDFQGRVAKAICEGVRVYVEGSPQAAVVIPDKSPRRF